MCLMCDGYSEEEIHAQCDQLIAEYGWVVQQIGGGDIDEPPWSYTMGLSHGFDHPELVVVGLAPQRAIVLLNGLGRRVRNGGSFVPGSLAENAGGSLEVTFGPVHPLLWEGPLLVGWRAYYESRGLAPDQRALQVVLPVEMVGARAQGWQPCLHEADCPIGRDNGPSRHPLQQHRRRMRRHS